MRYSEAITLHQPDRNISEPHLPASTCTAYHVKIICRQSCRGEVCLALDSMHYLLKYDQLRHAADPTAVCLSQL
jgi:hypothetical protein